MEETKLSTRVLIVSSIVLLVILVTGPLGYKYLSMPLAPSLISLLVAVIGGVIIVVVGLIFLVIAFKNGLERDRNLVAVAIVLSLIPLVLMGPQMNKAQSVPPIHDISTDGTNPPAFVALKEAREAAPNGAEYGSEQYPAEQLAEETMTAYPNVQPIITDLTVAEAVDRADQVLREMGLEVVDVNTDAGLVEATATTFWFGFKDDMVIRAMPYEGSTKVDIRSMSRVGQSDVGANAARIEKFTSQF